MQPTLAAQTAQLDPAYTFACLPACLLAGLPARMCGRGSKCHRSSTCRLAARTQPVPHLPLFCLPPACLLACLLAYLQAVRVALCSSTFRKAVVVVAALLAAQGQRRRWGQRLLLLLLPTAGGTLSTLKR